MGARNQKFTTQQPFLKDDNLSNTPSHVAGPFSFLNPTSAHFSHVASPSAGSSDHHHYIGAKWSSRNNRKGRHALALSPSLDASLTLQTPKRTSSARETFRGILRMFTYFPVWDISWLVATIFTLGSVVWVFNAFFVWYPSVDPSSTFKNEILYGGGITAFVGATIFEIGSVLLMLEAINENKDGDFGWAIEEAIDNFEHSSGDDADGDGKGVSSGVKQDRNLTIRRSECTHHHVNKRNLVGRGKTASKDADAEVGPSVEQQTQQKKRTWTWWPTAESLRTHYLHELGFLACSAQMFGATIFWIAGFTALPGILNKLSPGLEDGVYWTPQVVGGSGFIVSGTLFMIETQKRWYIPAWSVLGWWIGLFNLIGGVGFTLSPAFGYDTSSWAQYQAGCATFWGSWAFLIGSVIQWYESLDKYPVEVVKR